MSKKMESEEPLEKLTSLRITSLDDDDDDDEPVINGNGYGNSSNSKAALYDDDEEDDDDEEEHVPVVLGFVEKAKHKWSLARQLFPSKAGGTPAWLDPINLPNGRSCLCDFCDEPLQFLVQVYAPLTDKESTFHRTFFMFMCTSMSCLLKDQHEQWKKHPEKARRSVKVFRCQLPKFNSFYSSEAPKYNGNDKPSSVGAVLCSWCGTWKGDKVCGNCKRTHYCSEKHQAAHWRSSHRSECQKWSITQDTAGPSSNATSTDLKKFASNYVWTEYEIINEDESEYDTEMSEDIENADSSLVISTKPDESMNSMMETFEGDAEKKSWASFQQKLAQAPEQVLRYCKNPQAKPLWPVASGRLSRNEIPKCNYCGGSQAFEFQILPQLLYYFGVKNDVNSLDWATIVVYTCEDSCEGSVAYKEEFPWVQLVSQSTR